VMGQYTGLARRGRNRDGIDLGIEDTFFGSNYFESKHKWNADALVRRRRANPPFMIHNLQVRTGASAFR